MSTTVEKLEHNMVKLTVEVSAEDFDKAIEKAYQKNKNRISVPGFRKGHAPLQMIERMYGVGIFYEDAANLCIQETYPKESDDTKLEFVSRPEFDVSQMEKGKPFIYTAVSAVRPEVMLGEYKGLEVEKAPITVTDTEIDEEVKKEQEKNSRMIDVDDRPVEKGDTVTLDYAGTVDGVAFDGGTAKDQNLVIGSETFIPGFEDQLVGAALEEEKDVNVTFPEDYQAKDLAGKAAVFKCTVHKIQKKELPELDDDFAKDVSEFDTLDEYKEDVRKNLTEKKEKEAKTARENAAVDKLIEKSEMDIPKPMIDSQVSQMYEDFANRLKSQGIPIDMYLQYQGSDENKLKEQMRPQAEKRIKTRLVLEEVAKKENIEISEEKLDEEIKKMAEQYKMEPDKLKELLGDYEKEQMKKDMAVQEAVTLLTDNAREV
ncbi:MAG TPA: trigger factor [Lachnospiraceae bacterium]|nr:trigger factor [Lachnospiraceae bacterium]